MNRGISNSNPFSNKNVEEKDIESFNNTQPVFPGKKRLLALRVI